MGSQRPLATSAAARRSILALGGAFVASAAIFPVLPFVDDASAELWAVLGVLVGGPGLVLLYGGYRLPRTEIRPDRYSTVARWCLRGVAAGIAVMAPIALASDSSDVVPNALLLTALGSLAGFGAGLYDARAKSKQLELEETIDELETSNERLERHKRYTDAVLDAIDDVFYVLDREGNLKRWNESLADVTGYTAAEIEAMSAADFFEPDDRDAVVAAVREGFETGSVDVMLDVRTKDGESVPFEFVASTLEDPEGETVLAGVGRDVTEQLDRQRRLEDLVEQLEESNERLEQFAYAASHDLQEPLRMVSSYLQMIERRYGDRLDEDGREFVEFAVDGADRMREMISGLLEYSRVETRGDPFEPVELDAVLADVREDLRVRIQETDAEITAESLPRVEGDAGQLRQVFQNLLDNAIEYSGDDPPRVHVAAERDGERWQISVRDEGIGIDPDDADRVFEVFQSLHTPDEYDGTGIGLALCERVVERHGGDIWVDSEPGETTTFSFTLPAVDDGA